MLNLENFMKLLEDALPSKDSMSLDEKIMSKKAARRRRKKLAAAKRAAEEQVKKEQEKQSSEELEEKQESTGTSLIIYKEPTQDDYEEISEDFTKVISSLDNAMGKHKQEIEQAMSLWKQAGEDQPCPEDAWNMLDSSVKTLQNTIEQTLNSVNVEKLAKPELQILDRYLTGVNGYLEKASQQILASKPNLVEADFQAPTASQNTEITTTTGTSLTTTSNADISLKTGTSLVPSGSTALTIPDTTPLEDNLRQNKNKDKNKRTKEKLVTYKRFWDNFKTLKNSFDALYSGIKIIYEAIKKGAKALLNLALQPVSFLNDKLFAFLTSPLAKDIIKTFMYANPFTKMLFDGDFGKIGIDNPLEKVHNALNKLTHIADDKGKKDPTKEDPGNYTERKLPKSLEGKTLKQLKKEYYSNKALVDLINVSYNHPDVKIQDKADLRKYTTSIPRAFKAKNVDLAKNKFNSLIKSCDKICDYMDWLKPRDWQNLITKYVTAKGNTEKDIEKIKGRNKPKSKEKDRSITDKVKNMSKEEIDQLKKALGIQDSYKEFKLNKLERLLEEAEGDK